MPLWACNSAIWASTRSKTAGRARAQLRRARCRGRPLREGGQAVKSRPRGHSRDRRSSCRGERSLRTPVRVDGPSHLHGRPIGARTLAIQIAAEDTPGFEQAVDPLGHPTEVADGAAGAVEEGGDERVDAKATLLVEGIDGVLRTRSAIAAFSPARLARLRRVRSGPRTWRSCGSASCRGSTEAATRRGGPRRGVRPRPDPLRAGRCLRRSTHA